MDITTKRRIDEARDILVGKVPDPKSQVEQITIALTYKFMDDMDKETIELGGKATFFTGEFEKYSWSNIFDPKLGGFDLINLYSEALTTLNQNSNMPQLFRDLFKNAFLPYRDPETLKSFLKVINGFRYDHSENLGDAYEYLLSVLSSQGDAGQFRTPRHIIDFIVKIIDPKKNETILDPACGTGGFLISSYRHILQQNTINASGDKLTPDDRQRLINNIVGYDISPDMVRLSLMNMYLHLFQNPKIYEYDTLTSEERWQENYDVILANPPFMTPKGGIRPHKRFSIQAKRSEVLFVDYIMEHLNANGRAGVIVPEGIVFQSQNAYQELRKQLVDGNYLYAVVSLPAGIFNPYSGVKTSILLMDRTFAKQKDDILFVKINNDGYDLGAQRREIKGSDIPDVIKIIKDYMEGNDVSDNVLVTMASKKDIAEQDYILVGERYKEAIVVNSDYPLVELGKIAIEIRNGKNVTQIDERGKYRVTRIQTIADGTFDLNKTKWTNDEPGDNYFMEEGDILLSHINSYDHLAKTAIFIGINEKVVHGINLINFRLNRSLVKPSYVISCMKSDKFVNRAKTFAQKAVNQASIKVSDLKQIKIPLPPLHIQEEIVKEIEGYQKIIDGAKQVVENYNPTIKIDPSWKMIKLGDVFKLSSGLGLTAKNRTVGKYNVYGGNGITGYHNDYFVENKTIVIGRVGEYCGAVHLTTEKCWVTDNALMVTEYKIDIEQEYLLHILNQININQYAKIGGQPSISQSTVYDISIPLPSSKTQQQIVNNINEEMAIVDQNKRLIAIFEQKIKDKVAEVWGE